MLQSELELQLPQTPLEHLPLPLQSELLLQPPHLPPEHLPVLQSELELQLPHLPPEHLPWPLPVRARAAVAALAARALAEACAVRARAARRLELRSEELVERERRIELDPIGRERGDCDGGDRRLGIAATRREDPTTRRRSFIGSSYHQPATGS